jgi:deazaflavin-dependent oxidoreductase (nitroreductase family)
VSPHPPENKPPASGRLAVRAAGLLRVRWIVRLPVTLYRARLGFLLGSRLLMLEHTGRTTGARRYAVLEVIGHPLPGTYIVVSGFGARAQWFRNVRAHPGVRVWAGAHRPAPATARLLTAEEARAALDSYAARHPRAWNTLRPVLEATLGAPIGGHDNGLPLIALDLARRALDLNPASAGTLAGTRPTEDSVDVRITSGELAPDIACDLGEKGAATQEQRWRRLGREAGLGRAETADGLEIRFRDEAAVERVLRDLVSVESGCCAWAQWEVRRAGGELVLRVSSTPEGAAVLHSMFRADPETGPGER